ncbi:MAG: hypothetical protein LBD90_03100, partial [Bifidobacteriaceae bacterium]|nr:hypothetical protein [Bifidobacteriaceae bacterium]
MTANGGNDGAGIGGGAGDLSGTGGAGGSVVISGGTVTAAKAEDKEGADIGPGRRGSAGRVVVTGGSVNCVSAAPVPQPVNADGEEVYLATLTLEGAGDDVAVLASQVTTGPYGVQGARTRDGGRVYAWLPAATQADGIVLVAGSGGYTTDESTAVGENNEAAFTLKSDSSMLAYGTVVVRLNGSLWPEGAVGVGAGPNDANQSAIAVPDGTGKVAVTGFAGSYPVFADSEDTGVIVALKELATSEVVLKYYRPAASDYSLSAPDAVYNGQAHPATVTAATTLGQNAGALTVYYTGTGATDYPKSTAPPVGAGTYAVSVGVAGVGWANGVRYLPVEDLALGNYEIAKAPQTGFGFVDPEPTAQVYSPSFSFTNLTSGGQGGGQVSYAIRGGDGAASINPGTGVVSGVTAVGSILVEATRAGDANYLPATASYTLRVVKADQSGLELTGLADGYTYGDAGFAVGLAGALGGGAVTFAVLEGDAVSVDADSGQVSILGAGAFRIAA